MQCTVTNAYLRIPDRKISEHAVNIVMKWGFGPNHFSQTLNTEWLKKTPKHKPKYLHVSVFKTIDSHLTTKWNLLGRCFYGNRQRGNVLVLVRQYSTCCPSKQGVEGDQVSPSGSHPNSFPTPKLCCWHSHANLSPLVITLPLNQLTTTAGVRLLTVHLRVDGWRDESQE